MKHIAIALGAVIFFIAIVIGYAVSGYNRALTYDEEANGRWAEVENQLKRRYDLIPNLVQTVKGVAAHEKEIFTALAEARKGYAGAKTTNEKAQAASRYEGAIGRLLVIVEKYPTLRSNESFNKLMDELAGTENRVAVARRRYNEGVKQLNLATRRFPSSVFASMAGVEKREFFEVKEAEKEAPKVDFSSGSGEDG